MNQVDKVESHPFEPFLPADAGHFSSSREAVVDAFLLPELHQRHVAHCGILFLRR